MGKGRRKGEGKETRRREGDKGKRRGREKGRLGSAMVEVENYLYFFS